jgi:Lon protease-like protein
MAVSDLPGVLPLFPLPNVVLFPGMPLPLHVFEPRYRAMVEDASAGDRLIGMVLLKPGWESDYQGRPPVYGIGCAGRMEQCERLDDGRFDIVLRGVTRFSIVEEHGGRRYRLASVQAQDDALGDAARLEGMRRRVVAAIGRISDGPAVLVMQPELPHDLFVNALCQSLPLDPVERQSLLDCESVVGRCERLLEILEFKVLEETYGRKGEPSVH